MRVVREPGGREDNSEKGVGALSMPMATPHHMRATHRSTHTHAYRHASLTGRRAEASSWRAAAAVGARESIVPAHGEARPAWDTAPRRRVSTLGREHPTPSRVIRAVY